MNYLKSKKVLIPLVLVLGIVLTAVLVTAFDHHPRREMMHDFINYRIDRELEALNLTPDQKTELDAIRQNVWTELESIHEQRMANKQELIQEFSKAQPNAEYIKSFIDKKIDNVRNVSYNVVDQLLTAHKILTPEQREQLIQRVEELHAKKGGCHGPCRH